jgi:hypothetical protein
MLDRVDEAFTAPQATDPVFFASAGYAASEGNGTWTFAPEITLRPRQAP